MRVPVELPSLLWDYSGGARTVEVDARTLGEALTALFAANPLLRVHLCDESGALRRHVWVFLNDRESRSLPPSHDLRAGDRLRVVQAVSGG